MMHYYRVRRHGDAEYQPTFDKDLACTVEGCVKKRFANSLCPMHNRRAVRHGDPNYINPKCNRDGNYKARARASTAQWKRDNWDTYKAYLAARKARVKLATPPWVDLAAIEKIYRECPKGFHVDHIEPINGADRSGLHVPWNLQYLPALDNLKKSNKTS